SGNNTGLSLNVNASGTGSASATMSSSTLADNGGDGALVRLFSNGLGGASANLSGLQVLGNAGSGGHRGPPGPVGGGRGPGRPSVSNSPLSGNGTSSPFNKGGGLFVSASTSGAAPAPSINVALTNSTFEGNVSAFGGGAALELFSNTGTIRASVTGCTFD